MKTVSNSHAPDTRPALMAAEVLSPPLRCSKAEDLPSFLRAVLSVVEAGQGFGWWVEQGAEPVLDFVIDKVGAAYRIRLSDGVTSGIFADFFDAIRHGAALSSATVDQSPQEAHGRAASERASRAQ